MDFQWYVDKRLVHEIHTSERKSFRGCRRRWDWIFRDNYYPMLTEKPLDFGVAYHEAMEVLYNPDTWGMDKEIILQYAIAKFVEKTNKQRAHYKANYAHDDYDEVDQDFDDRVQLGIGMLTYFWNYKEPFGELRMTPVKVEVEFMVPIRDPDTLEDMKCKCAQCWERWCLSEYGTTDDEGIPIIKAVWDGLPVVFAGRIDMLAQDQHGDLWIVDWKTTARLADNHEWLENDDQISSYCWALWSIGMKVRGFIYYEQKKAYPVPPKRNKNIRLGRMYSVASGLDTSYEIYKAEVEKGDAAAYAAGLYDAYLNGLKEHDRDFFIATPMHKTEYEYDEIAIHLGQEAQDMLSLNLRLYPNPGRFACGSCAFKVPCVEKNQGGDYVYALETLFEKRPAYYLRQELSTDKKSAL